MVACRWSWSRSSLLAANGLFLALVGGAQVTFELASHFAGVGPLGARFLGSPYTLGFVEAHGLAAILGILLMRASRQQAPPRSWHLVAVAVHALLGGANLLFWGSFVQMDLVTPGLVATSLHGVFLFLHATVVVAGHRAVGASPR